jgi:hypothetical protein
MLAFILLSSTLLGPCDPSVSPTLRVVCPYLEALARLDHDAMAALWAPDLLIVDRHGDAHAPQPAFARDMRAYERAARTLWGYAIDSVRGDSAFTTLTESNEFYDLLGVGPRTQREIYVASGGRIRLMRGMTLEHPGGNFDSAYTAFKRWVIDTAAVRDTVLVGDGGLRFTAKSAEPMRRWLKAWRSRERHETRTSHSDNR